MTGGTLGGSDQGGAGPVYPLPNQLEKSAQLSGRVLQPQRPPVDHVGPRGMGAKLGKSRRGRQEGPSRTGAVGEEWRTWPCPLEPQKPAELPGRVPCPLKPPPGHMGPGNIGGRREERQAGGALQDRRRGRGAEDICPAHSRPGSCWAPRWGPHPLRPKAGSTSGSLLFN